MGFRPNHVHLLLTPQHDQAVSKLMQFLGRLYVRRFN
ncbi:MAG: transposase [Pseudomonadales bacterium]|nr:transposase [Pseudomonadales bacterium]